MVTTPLALALSVAIAAPPPQGTQEIYEPDIEAIRQGVRSLQGGSKTDGTWALVRSLISAGLATGLAVWLGTTDVLTPEGQTDGGLTKLLIVASLGVAAASQVANGLYDFFAQPATYESAQLLLDDPIALEASGLFFLRDRALDGRDRRIRGAITEMTTAVGSGIGAGLLFTSDIALGRAKNIIAGITLAIGGIQLVTGMLKLFRLSTEEKIYEAVMNTATPVEYEEEEEEEGDEPGGPQFGAFVVPDGEGRASFGLAVTGRF